MSTSFSREVSPSLFPWDSKRSVEALDISIGFSLSLLLCNFLINSGVISSAASVQGSFRRIDATRDSPSTSRAAGSDILLTCTGQKRQTTQAYRRTPDPYTPEACQHQLAQLNKKNVHLLLRLKMNRKQKTEETQEKDKFVSGIESQTRDRKHSEEKY